VGVNAVEWDLDHRAAHHGIYQQLLQSLADSGVLLAIATKNDPGLVQTVLAERRLLVKSEALFPVVASWGPKSVSVSQILESWNVGAECVVFIDDSDLELAEVKTAHPAIECKKFEKDPGQISSLVWDLVNKFGTRFDSAEDGYRLESLRAGAEFKSQITGAESMEAVLASANGVLRLVAISNPPDPRSLELINKTNQFNLNGRRWTDLEWQEYLTTPGCVAWLGSYEDRYGPLGKITVIAGRLDGQRELKVDVWVMSCRAFSRRIEFALLSELYQRCDIERISFQYCQTDRNGPLTEALCSVLGSPPQTGCYLAKEQFDPRKPAWYLKVE
jgi:FkbH-like protein